MLTAKAHTLVTNIQTNLHKISEKAIGPENLAAARPYIHAIQTNVDISPQARAELSSSSLAWSVAASLSLLTSRQILFWTNWHYPFHLLALHLLVLIGWKSATTWKASRPRLNIPGASPISHRSSQKLAFMIQVLSYVISLPLYSQALLHFNNTPILALLGLLVFVPPAVLGAIRAPTSSKAHQIRRIVAVMVALFIVLAWDYRLTVNGLVFSIFAIGIFSVLQTYAYSLDQESVIHFEGLDSALVLFASLAVSLLLAFLFEDTFRAVPDFFPTSVPKLLVLLLNFAATSFAVELGGQTFAFNKDQTTVTWQGFQKPSAIWPVISMTGIVTAFQVGTYTTMVNGIQLLCFPMAALALFDINYRSLFNSLRPASGRSFDVLQFLAQLAPTTHTPRDRRLSAARSPISPGYPKIEDDEEQANGEAMKLSILAPSSPTGSSHGNLFSLSLVVLTMICWILSLIWTGSSPPNHAPVVFLDKGYRAKSQFDIVLSMHHEPLSALTATVSLIMAIPEINALAPRVFVYTKNSKIDTNLIRRAIPTKHISDVPVVIFKPNIGREGETYLTHMLTHWDDLGTHTLFTQAQTHNPRELKGRIAQFFDREKTGFLPLGFAGNTCRCDSATCADRFWADDSGVVQDVYKRANRLKDCPSSSKRLLLSYKGQFIASAKRIKGVEKGVYEYVRGLLHDEKSFVHQKEYLAGRRESIDAPVFGFSLERMWASLLQCSEERVALRCPTLLSSWRSGGEKKDCQCLDM